jgi:hypothetical protein
MNIDKIRHFQHDGKLNIHLKEEPGTKQMGVADKLQIFALLATAISLFYTGCEMYRSQTWKQAEMGYAEFKEFAADSSVKLMNSFLDYSTRDVKLVGKRKFRTKVFFSCCPDHTTMTLYDFLT